MRLTQGARAPEFVHQDLDGTSVALEEYRGRYVLYARDMGDHLPLDTVFDLVSPSADGAPGGRNPSMTNP